MSLEERIRRLEEQQAPAATLPWGEIEVCTVRPGDPEPPEVPPWPGPGPVPVRQIIVRLAEEPLPHEPDRPPA